MPWQAECQSMQPRKTGCTVSWRWTFRAETAASSSAQCGASARNARKRSATLDMQIDRECYALKIDERDFRCKLALGSIARADPHALSLPQLSNAAASQGLHVDKNVGRVRAARDEAIALATVEPLHRRVETGPLRLRQIASRSFQR